MAPIRLNASNARKTDLAGAFAVESDLVLDEAAVGTVAAHDFDDATDELSDAEWFDIELASQWRKGATYRDWFQSEDRFLARTFNRRQRRVTIVGIALMLAGIAVLAMFVIGV